MGTYTPNIDMLLLFVCLGNIADVCELLIFRFGMMKSSDLDRLIYSYGGQGLDKKELSDEEAEAHTVIYSSNCPIPKEPRTTKTPIAVRMTNTGQTLDPTSRLNFEKEYTVEKNQEILDYGMTTAEGLRWLCAYAQVKLPLDQPADNVEAADNIYVSCRERNDA